MLSASTSVQNAGSTVQPRLCQERLTEQKNEHMGCLSNLLAGSFSTHLVPGQKALGSKKGEAWWHPFRDEPSYRTPCPGSVLGTNGDLATKTTGKIMFATLGNDPMQLFS